MRRDVFDETTDDLLAALLPVGVVPAEESGVVVDQPASQVGECGEIQYLGDSRISCDRDLAHGSRLVGPTEQGEPGVALGRGRGVVDLSAVDEGGHPAPLDDEPVRIPIAKLFDRRIEGQVGQRPTEMRPLEMLPVGPASQGQSGVGYADLPICRRGQFAVKLEVPAQGDRQFHQIVGVPGVVQVFTAANRPSRDRFPLAASPVARRSDPRPRCEVEFAVRGPSGVCPRSPILVQQRRPCSEVLDLILPECTGRSPLGLDGRLLVGTDGQGFGDGDGLGAERRAADGPIGEDELGPSRPLLLVQGGLLESRPDWLDQPGRFSVFASGDVDQGQEDSTTALG